jgi:hypothetical protein
MALLRLPALFMLVVAACATAGKSDPNQQKDAPTNDDASLTVDGNNCATQPCDILSQCGCVGGSACDVDGTDLNGTACRTIAATAVGEGGGCSNVSGCQAGTVCLGNAPGVCKKYCDANTDCGQPRGQCLIEITDGTNPIPGVPKTCSSSCDPTNVAAGGCPAAANVKCGLFNTGATTNINFVDCAAAGTLVQGGNCGPSPGNDALCGPNFLCTSVTAGVFACRRTCIVGGTGICVGAQTCIPFNPVFMLGAVNYGVCN